MPKMVITHAVVEVDRWLQGKAERVEVIGSFATNVTDYVAADGSNNVAITADIHDMAGLQALMASPSPEDTAAQERHGVIQPIIAYVEK
jgi:glycerate kinase